MRANVLVVDMILPKLSPSPTMSSMVELRTQRSAIVSTVQVIRLTTNLRL
jgi:hypothetical protein